MPIDVRQYKGCWDEFRAEIGAKAETRALWHLRRLRDEGSNLRAGSKPLGDGIFELTVSFNRMEYRLAYAFHGGAAVILHCFIKKSKKTPATDLEKAQARFKSLLLNEIESGDVAIN
jgi:phage-related protein